MPTFLESEPPWTATADGPEGATGGGAPMLNEPSDLGAAGLVADRFAAADAARMAELDRLIRAGKGSEAPPLQHQEDDPMPCSSCGSKNHNKRTCPEDEKPVAAPPAKLRNPTIRTAAAAMAEPPPEVRRSIQLAGSGRVQLAEATTAELIEVIAACRTELARRVSALEAELEAAKKAVAA